MLSLPFLVVFKVYIKYIVKKINNRIYWILALEVPKREIFVTELFTLSDPIWIGDMRIEPKKLFV